MPGKKKRGGCLPGLCGKKNQVTRLTPLDNMDSFEDVSTESGESFESEEFDLGRAFADGGSMQPKKRRTTLEGKRPKRRVKASKKPKLQTIEEELGLKGGGKRFSKPESKKIEKAESKLKDVIAEAKRTLGIVTLTPSLHSSLINFPSVKKALKRVRKLGVSEQRIGQIVFQMATPPPSDTDEEDGPGFDVEDPRGAPPPPPPPPPPPSSRGRKKKKAKKGSRRARDEAKEAKRNQRDTNAVPVDQPLEEQPSGASSSNTLPATLTGAEDDLTQQPTPPKSKRPKPRKSSRRAKTKKTNAIPEGDQDGGFVEPTPEILEPTPPSSLLERAIKLVKEFRQVEINRSPDITDEESHSQDRKFISDFANITNITISSRDFRNVVDNPDKLDEFIEERRPLTQEEKDIQIFEEIKKEFGGVPDFGEGSAGSALALRIPKAQRTSPLRPTPPRSPPSRTTFRVDDIIPENLRQEEKERPRRGSFGSDPSEGSDLSISSEGEIVISPEDLVREEEIVVGAPLGTVPEEEEEDQFESLLRPVRDVIVEEEEPAESEIVIETRSKTQINRDEKKARNKRKKAQKDAYNAYREALTTKTTAEQRRVLRDALLATSEYDPTSLEGQLQRISWLNPLIGNTAQQKIIKATQKQEFERVMGVKIEHPDSEKLFSLRSGIDKQDQSVTASAVMVAMLNKILSAENISGGTNKHKESFTHTRLKTGETMVKAFERIINSKRYSIFVDQKLRRFYNNPNKILATIIFNDIQNSDNEGLIQFNEAIRERARTVESKKSTSSNPFDMSHGKLDNLLTLADEEKVNRHTIIPVDPNADATQNAVDDFASQSGAKTVITDPAIGKTLTQIESEEMTRLEQIAIEESLDEEKKGPPGSQPADDQADDGQPIEIIRDPPTITVEILRLIASESGVRNGLVDEFIDAGLSKQEILRSLERHAEEGFRTVVSAVADYVESSIRSPRSSGVFENLFDSTIERFGIDRKAFEPLKILVKNEIGSALGSAIRGLGPDPPGDGPGGEPIAPHPAEQVHHQNPDQTHSLLGQGPSPVGIRPEFKTAGWAVVREPRRDTLQDMANFNSFDRALRTNPNYDSPLYAGVIRQDTRRFPTRRRRFKLKNVVPHGIPFR